MGLIAGEPVHELVVRVQIAERGRLGGVRVDPLAARQGEPDLEADAAGVVGGVVEKAAVGIRRNAVLTLVAVAASRS